MSPLGQIFDSGRSVSNRGLEYRAPVDSSSKEPPYGSRQIVRWMVLDGRRMKRHNSPFASLADKNKNARGRIAYSALVRLPLFGLFALVLIVVGAVPTLAFGLLAFFLFGTNTAIVIAGAAAVAATLVVLWFSVSLSDRLCEPLLKARGVSHDEALAGMVAGLAPLALIALIVQGLA